MARTRDKSTTTLYINKEYNWLNGVLQTSGVLGTASVVDYDVMVDEVVPGFRARSGKGEIFINPMSKLRSQHEVAYYPGVQVVSSRGSGGTTTTWKWEVDRSAVPAYDPRLDAGLMKRVGELEALAITEAYGGVGTADVATLTELAELKETLSFLYSPVRGMLNITRRFQRHYREISRVAQQNEKRYAAWRALSPSQRRGKRRPDRLVVKPFKWGNITVNDIASLWLAYRYAVMPLVYTFQDIQKHLEREKYPVRDTSRASSSGAYDSSVTSAPSPRVYDSRDWHAITRTTVTADIVSRAGVLYTPDWSLDRQLGFQIHRVPMAMYEAIPLSFVTDWFHNGASYYNALTAELRALKIHGSWVSSKVVFQCRVYRKGISLSPGLAGFGECLTNQTTGILKLRRKTSLSDVKLRARVELNAKRIADSLALIKVILLSLKR